MTKSISIKNGAWLAAAIAVVAGVMALAPERVPALAGDLAVAAPQGTAQTQTIPAHRFGRRALAGLKDAFNAYEKAREALAADRTGGVAELAETIRAAIAGAAEAEGETLGAISILFEHGQHAAMGLKEATDIEAARTAFGEVSRYLIGFAQADARLQEGWNAFFCPMFAGFAKWFQAAEQMANPYMGTMMLQCGTPTKWETELVGGAGGTTTVSATGTSPASSQAMQAGGETAGEAQTREPGAIAYYTCSMHPSVRQHEDGACPICGMDLVPVLQEELETGVVLIDAVRRQQIGVRTAAVHSAPMTRHIRAVGRVTYDESRLADVTLKVRGWIQELLVSRTGERVERGQPLFTLYSPELYAAQRDYLQALSDRDGGSGGGGSAAFLEAARERLKLWDLTDEQIDGIAASGSPLQYVPILAPAGGYVIEKLVVEGAAVMPGQRLYRIAALDRVWIEAEVYESDLPLLHEGQPAEVDLPYLPGEGFGATITYVYPYMMSSTRTGMVRLEIANPALKLKPDMYANVRLAVELGTLLQVPSSAVIYAGPRRLVFVDMGEGRLMPKEIQVGRVTADYHEVLSGLSEGEIVVTSGNFLIAAESRLRSAATYWGGSEGDAGHNH